MDYLCIKANELERVGRTFVWNDIVWCGFSGTGIRFMTNAQKVTFHLVGDSSTDGQITEGLTRVAVLVDDERVADLMMTKPYAEVAVSSETGLHKIQLIKISECAMSTFGVKDVVLESNSDITVSQVEANEKKIEFIGDSITCGYGVDTESPDIPFKTDTEDCTKAYAYKTAKLLHADYSLVSLSGYGIITGFTDTDDLHRDQLMPTFYEKCGFSYLHPVFNGEAGPAYDSLEWDFSKFVPDVVVINLGTNDHSYCKEFKDRLDWYKKDYKVFLHTVRKRNPGAKILCCLGLMEAGMNVQALKELVSEYQEESKDTQVFFLEIPLQKPENGYASDGHPTALSHSLTAELVAQKIKSIGI